MSPTEQKPRRPQSTPSDAVRAPGASSPPAPRARSNSLTNRSDTSSVKSRGSSNRGDPRRLPKRVDEKTKAGPQEGHNGKPSSPVVEPHRQGTVTSPLSVSKTSFVSTTSASSRRLSRTPSEAGSRTSRSSREKRSSTVQTPVRRAASTTLEPEDEPTREVFSPIESQHPEPSPTQSNQSRRFTPVPDSQTIPNTERPNFPCISDQPTANSSYVMSGNDEQSQKKPPQEQPATRGLEESGREGVPPPKKHRRHRHLYPHDSPADPANTTVGETEMLMPIDFRSTHPQDHFFVRYMEQPTNLKPVVELQRFASKGETKVDLIRAPRNEEEMLLEQFAEFTDDDSFFSSGSSVLSEAPDRFEEEEGPKAHRDHAVSSVKESLFLHTLDAASDKRVREEHERMSALRAPEEVWLHQVHHRAIALNHSSCFLFPPRWYPRVMLYNVLHHWAFELYTLLSILAYCTFQASFRRSPENLSGEFERPDWMLFADVFFTVLLTVEVLARMFTCGILLHPRAYFRSPWNWLDFAVLILMYMTCTKWRELWNFTAWRLIRIIKCCRYAPMWVSLKILAKALLRCTTRLFCTTMYLVFFLYFFALVGLHLFITKLQRRCVSDTTGEITSQLCNPHTSGKQWFYWGHKCAEGYTCVRSYRHNPHFGFRTFDDIGHSLLSVFQIVTFQGWTSLLVETNDAMNTFAFMFYAFAIIVGAWIIPSLFIGVFVEKLVVMRRRYLYKQVQRFDEMLTEQRERMNSSIRMGDYVMRDGEGCVDRYPGYDKRHLNEKVERGWFRSLGETPWTDEMRVQLHLSFSRHAGANLPQPAPVAAGNGASHGGAAEGSSRPPKGPSTFLLGGTVGELRLAPEDEEVEREDQMLAKRQQRITEDYPFLQRYQEKHEAEDQLLTERLKSVKRSERHENSTPRIEVTLETPGVIPHFSTTNVSSNASSHSFLKEFGNEDLSSSYELLVNDPEGGDLGKTKTIGQRWGIIRNIVHMQMEGYPRIITQYLYQQWVLGHRYGLRPLQSMNKYEDYVMNLLKRRRLERIRFQQTQARVDPSRAHRMNLSEDDETEGMEGQLCNDPMFMAHKIQEDAIPTWLNFSVLALIFLNAVLNAIRYDGVSRTWDNIMFYISVCFSCFFVLELILHAVALGFRPFLLNIYYPLEFIFVVLSFFQLGFDRNNTLALFNWIRFLKLLKVVPVNPVRNVTRVLLIAIPDLLIALFFFSVYMLMWLLIGMSFFGSRFSELSATTDYYTRITFDSFSFAVYAIAQAFSVNRDQWLYLSWSGMRARGGYTIMYFIATVLVAWIFRFLFVAICVAAWQAFHERTSCTTVDRITAEVLHSLRARRRQLGRAGWFDFTVWKSFKHLHGGFTRERVSPDAICALSEDMQRFLRLTQSRSRYYIQLHDALEEKQDTYTDDELRYAKIGGHLQRVYPHEADKAEKEQKGNVSYRYSQGLIVRGTNNEEVSTVRAPECEGVEHLTTRSLLPSGYLTPRRTGRLQTSMDEVPSLSVHSSQDRATARLTQRLLNRYREGTEVSAQLYSLLRQPEQVDNEDVEEEEMHPVHVLLPGPQLPPCYITDHNDQRVLDRCEVCRTVKQCPLPSAEGVAARSVDDLHQEHCHVAAARGARQTVLLALLGYVDTQIEMEVKPTRAMVEAVLGQAWSCGMLMYETLDRLFDPTVPLEHRSWDPLMDALKLQQWVTGLQVGEEQVGRSALAYLIAHKADEDNDVSKKIEEAPLGIVPPPKSIWNNDDTFFFLAPTNGFRVVIANFVESDLFELIVLMIILAAAVCLAVYTPGNDNKDMGGSYNSNKYDALHILDDIFVALFAIEMVLRWIARGVVLPVGRAYVWHLWNLFDFFIVVISFLSIVIGSLHLRYLKVFRAFRVVGYMRSSLSGNFSILARSLWTSVPTLVSVCLLMIMNYLVWSLLFVAMFYEKMSQCTDSRYTFQSTCESQGYKWKPLHRSFSNFYRSLLTTFELSTGAEWIAVIYQAVDSWEKNSGLVTNRHPYLGLVFIPYYYVSHFIFFSLLISASIYWYVRTRNAAVGVEDVASPSLARWQRMRSMLSHFDPRIRLLPMSNPVSHTLHRMVTHWLFEVIMAITIVLNAFVMSLEWSGMKKAQKNGLDVMQYIFLAVFTLELILRLTAHGLRSFTRGAFCWDFFVTVLSYLQIILNTTDDHYVPFDVNTLRLLRVGRLLSLFGFFPTPRGYFTLLYVAVTSAVTDLIAVGLFYALSVLVFAVAGLHMLGYIVPFGGYISHPYNNFGTLVNSIIMVFRLSTLENWSTMMRESMNYNGNYCSRGHDCGPTYWAPVYYIALLLCCFVLVVSLFMAVLVYHYMTLSRMHRDMVRWNDLFCLREAWTDEDPNATGLLHVTQLPIILEKLRPPLGVANRFNRVELLRLLHAYHIPQVGGVVRYEDVMQAVARRICAMAVVEKEVGYSKLSDGFSTAWQRVELQLLIFDESKRDEEQRRARDGNREAPALVARSLNRFRPQNYLESNAFACATHSVEEYFAVSYVQAAYRRDAGIRSAIVTRSRLWKKLRATCDSYDLAYHCFGFSHYPLDGPNPREEGTRRGLVTTYRGSSRVSATSRSNAGATSEFLPLYLQEDQSSAARGHATPPSRSHHHHRHSSAERQRSGSSAAPHPYLPHMYGSALEPEEKKFGREAEGAIRRGERRSEKLAKDAAIQRQSAGGRDSSRSAPYSPASECSFDVSCASTDRANRPTEGQPPLGGNLDALRDVRYHQKSPHRNGSQQKRRDSGSRQ